MRQSAVINWFNDEIASFLEGSSLVSIAAGDGDSHVSLAESRDEYTYPFVGIQKIAGTPDSAGIGSGELFVDDLTFDNSDILTQITYRRDTSLRVELIPLTDGDAKLRDDLAEDLTDYFAQRQRTGTGESDLTITLVDEATPQDRTDDFVRAEGVPVEVEYERYIVDDDPVAASEVNVDLDVADDPDNVGTDAFDESFS